jgi:hypothetical protein
MWVPTILADTVAGHGEGDPLSTTMRRHRPHTAFAVLVALFSVAVVAVASGVAGASPAAGGVDAPAGGSGSPGGSQPSPLTGDSEIIGFDFSYTKPDPDVMADAGYEFAIGYVSHTPAKNLTADHLAAYLDAGIHVGLVWETTAGRALHGHAAGKADGRAAEDQANALGYPVDAVMFFAVDKNTTASDYPAIQEYAEAFNRGTQRPVGIFGEADVIDHFVTDGEQPVQYGWQTAAWSGGRLSKEANLYKRIGHPSRPVPDGISPRAFDEVVKILPVPLAR